MLLNGIHISKIESPPRTGVCNELTFSFYETQSLNLRLSLEGIPDRST